MLKRPVNLGIMASPDFAAPPIRERLRSISVR